MYANEGGAFSGHTYQELLARVARFASALKSHGLQRGDRIVIFAENCWEWALADWGAQTVGIVTVPIYPTLPGDQAAYIVGDSEAKLILAGNASLRDRIAGLVSVPIVMLTHGDDSLTKAAAAATPDQAAWEAEIPHVAGPEDVATLIYTSGTTGPPKGAMLPHRAFVSLGVSIRSSLPVNSHDLFLSYLPLSHVYERFAGHVLPIAINASIAYAGSLATLSKDIVATNPTVMLCVPRFLEATREKIIDAIEKLPGIQGRLARLGLAQGLIHARGGFAPLFGALNALVLKKIRARLGTRLRFLVSGGSALPRHIGEFYRAIGLPVLQGYGLTETCAASAVNHLEGNRLDTVGPPINGVEIVIAQDGEILIRGASVMLGYYKQPEATVEAIDSDGFFHTGDIGCFDGGHLKITDRKKDILVLANGKNVAPQPIENKLRESEFIKEAVLFGDNMQSLVALIIPNFDRVQHYIESQGIKAPATPAEMLTFDPVRARIKEHVDRVNKTLADFEKVKKYELIAATFTVEGGELTPSHKVKRRVIKERYADVLKGMTRE